MYITNKEERLPVWAKQIIADLRIQIEILQNENDAVRSMGHIMADRNRGWFSIPGPPFGEDEESRKLFILDRNDPLAICSLGRGDVLFVGRHFLRAGVGNGRTGQS